MVMHFGGRTCVAEKFRHFCRDVSRSAQVHVLTLVKAMTTPRFQIPTIVVAGVVWTAQAGYYDNVIRECDDAERSCETYISNRFRSVLMSK
jgi:hypothetical protein